MEEKVTTTKTISRGTLGLRFMQNALRAKQLKEVEFEKAEVKDDGQWEVDHKVRDAWGLEPSSSSSQTISYETSYLPFIFSSEVSSSSDDNTQKLNGRRVFNKHGVEEIVQEKESETTSTSTAPDHKRFKVHPRPKSISAGSVALFGLPDQAPSTKNAKTTKQLIHDNSGVGADLHPRPLKQQPPDPNTKADLTLTSTPAKPVFLKPAGVDDPRVMNAESDIIDGARTRKKSKRIRPSSELPDGEEETKRKKKKKIQKNGTT